MNLNLSELYLNFACDSYNGSKFYWWMTQNQHVNIVEVVEVLSINMSRWSNFRRLVMDEVLVLVSSILWHDSIMLVLGWKMYWNWWMMGLCWRRWRCPIFVWRLWHPCMMHLKRGTFVQVCYLHELKFIIMMLSLLQQKISMILINKTSIDMRICSKHATCLMKAQPL